MLISQISRITLRYKFLLTVIAVILFLTPAVLHANNAESSENVQYDRADADTIKTLTNQILSTKDLAPRKTFGQWLMEKFTQWKGPNLNLHHGWIGIIFWIIIIWCVLTLIAILVHFIWTISKLIGSKVNLNANSLGISNGTIKISSYTQLYQMAQDFASNGMFREAIGTMTAALLRWLDSMEIVSFHESKTNGDYIREYSADSLGKNEFRKFINISDQTLYGNNPCNSQIYDNMNSLMEHIRDSVTKEE